MARSLLERARFNTNKEKYNKNFDRIFGKKTSKKYSVNVNNGRKTKMKQELSKIINSSELIMPLCIYYTIISAVIVIRETILHPLGNVFFISSFLFGICMCLFEGMLRLIIEINIKVKNETN